MTPPKRLTKEREQKIRDSLNELLPRYENTASFARAMNELLAEIDALRADLNIKEMVELTTKNCAAIRELEEVKKERDALRAQCESYLNYSKHLQTELGDSIEYQIGLKEERDAIKAENEQLEYKLACLLKHATGGLYSNPSYRIEDMYQQVDEHVEIAVEKALAQDDEACIDSNAKAIHSEKDVSDEESGK